MGDSHATSPQEACMGGEAPEESHKKDGTLSPCLCWLLPVATRRKEAPCKACGASGKKGICLPGWPRILRLLFRQCCGGTGGKSSQRHSDEVIAASEKVTVKLEDLAQWARTDISKWKRGLWDEAFTPLELRKDGQREALSRFRQSTHNSGLNFKDILKEKADLAVQLVLESSWPMKTVFERCWDQEIGLVLERERNWMGQLLVQTLSLFCLVQYI
ncbi:AT-rich interactive domain-containing protein 5B, partial [Ophiophagus hannah]